jgi:hypothetical protein
MNNTKFYIIQLVESETRKYVLRKDCKEFHWHGFGGDKEYKNLGSAIKMAQICRRRLDNKLNPDFSATLKLQLVEVTFEPCNPELPDSFYKPVKRVLTSIY